MSAINLNINLCSNLFKKQNKTMTTDCLAIGAIDGANALVECVDLIQSNWQTILGIYHSFTRFFSTLLGQIDGFYQNFTNNYTDVLIY